MREKPSIVSAAILYDWVVYKGLHHHVIQQEHMELPLLKKGIQGFYTSDGYFVSREDAREIAKSSGQIDKGFMKTLTSEDLW